MSGEITEISSYKIFGGLQKCYSHMSKELNSKINFSIFLPQPLKNKKAPVIFWLSGLTCTDRNFVEKAGAQKYASKYGIVIVCPDTSPRNLNIPGDSDSWDFGVGAGFYIDATKEPWSNNYRMYSYVTSELISLISSHFDIDTFKMSIMGHSMGGHGALICALKNPGLFRSVSAFAPICNPMSCEWGVKAFSGYFCDTECWPNWDATALIKNYQGKSIELFIDQGSEDQFLAAKQLLPSNLVDAATSVGSRVTFKLREGYDHSYFYIATFIEEHFDYHAKYLLDV